MPSQNSTGRQFDKTHAVTITATGVIAPYRFVTYAGAHAGATAPGAGAPQNAVQGISEEAAQVGEALSIVTGYSYLVQASEPIALGAFVKPAADGKAAVGTATAYCGKALGAVGSADDLVEVQILPHVYTPT